VKTPDVRASCAESEPTPFIHGVASVPLSSRLKSSKPGTATMTKQCVTVIALASVFFITAGSEVSAGWKLKSKHGSSCSTCNSGAVSHAYSVAPSVHHSSASCCTAAATCCGGLSAVSGYAGAQSAHSFLSGYEGLPDMNGGGVHYRYPYHSYRRPWFHPGPASTNVTIVW